MWWQVDGAYSFQVCPASEFVFTQLLYVIEDWCWSRSFFCVCTLSFFTAMLVLDSHLIPYTGMDVWVYELIC